MEALIKKGEHDVKLITELLLLIIVFKLIIVNEITRYHILIAGLVFTIHRKLCYFRRVLRVKEYSK